MGGGAVGVAAVAAVAVERYDNFDCDSGAPLKEAVAGRCDLSESCWLLDLVSGTAVRGALVGGPAALTTGLVYLVWLDLSDPTHFAIEWCAVIACLVFEDKAVPHLHQPNPTLAA